MTFNDCLDASKTASVVVTGASGFIGHRLIQALASAGRGGIAISRRDELDVAAGWRHLKRSRYLSGDVPQPVGCVIHLEARHHVFHRTESELAEIERVNIGGTREMLERAGQLGCRTFIYFSSIKAVRATGGVNTELAAGPGDSPYGRSKWAAEQLVRDWAGKQQGRSALILRPAVVYGPGNQANLYAMLDAVARRRFPLVGGARNIKSIVSLENVCKAVNHLLGRMTPGVQVFCLVDPASYPVAEIAAMMARSLGVPAPQSSIPLKAARLLALVGDGLGRMGIKRFPMNSTRLEGLIEPSHFSSEALVATGFVPAETTEEGILRLARWYQSRQSGRPGLGGIRREILD